MLTVLTLLSKPDSISHDKLWVTMMDMGHPLHLIDLLAKLYRKQLAKVKVAGTLSEWFRVKKGVRQGCVLSTYLFDILAETVMRETLDGFQGGLQIGGQMIMNLCCSQQQDMGAVVSCVLMKYELARTDSVLVHSLHFFQHWLTSKNIYLTSKKLSSHFIRFCTPYVLHST